jgi:signal transduction histidine kinase
MVMGLFSKIKSIFSGGGLRIYHSPVKKNVIVSAAIIIMVSFAFFFYFQHQTERSIIDSILEQQKQIQKDTTQALAQHIRSDMDSIMARLQGLSYSKYIQQGDYASNQTKSVLKSYYRQMNYSTPVDKLFILDANGIVKMNIVPKGAPTFLGKSFSFLEWVRETKNSMSPQYSDGFVGADGRYRIALTYPIITNSTNGPKYMGLIGVVIPTVDFLGYYGNIYDIDSKYLSILDRNGVLLAHPIASLIGKPFSGSYFQNISSHNKVLNNLISMVVFSGKPSSAIYEFVNGERLTSGYPIVLNGKTQYSAFIITPTSTIYSKINSIIATERLEMFSLILGIIAAVMVLILFLSRVNDILDKGIRERTIELKESNHNLSITNKKLESANEQLQSQDKIQKEFINVAAHELRTPIQPILSSSKLIRNIVQDNEQVTEYCDIIQRNSLRLKKLAENILDITRIESNTLRLEKEHFELDGLVHDIVKEFSNASDKNKKVKIEYDATINRHFTVYGDRIRIGQVIYNLIDNSIKFTSLEGIAGKENGSISINIDRAKSDKKRNNGIINKEDIKGKEGHHVIVNVTDNGKGIDKEIMPKLFTKFTTKSFQGTGLGLFISKSIIEAHGGRIWAVNNGDGFGSTFSFSLPLKE